MDNSSGTGGLRLTLGRKLLIAVFVFTGLFAANFLAYSHLLKELDTTAAAVDAAGRQRMLSQKLAYIAFQTGAGHAHDKAVLPALISEFEESLQAFKHGGYSRDFLVSKAPAGIAPLVLNEEAEWKPYKEAALEIYASGRGPASAKALAYIESHSDALLYDCNALTEAFRRTAVSSTDRMTRVMVLLIVINLLSALYFFYYAVKKIAAPLVLLDKAAAEITAGNFPDLKGGDSEDEVGSLFRTFSKMSRTIRLDQEKRAAISALMAITLEHSTLPELMQKFLDKLVSIPWLAMGAKGAIFLSDPGGTSLRLAAQRGLPPEALEKCSNIAFGHCVCGKTAAEKRAGFVSGPEKPEIFCGEIKPYGRYCVPIRSGKRTLGVLNIFSGPVYDKSELDFLDAVCSIIARAIESKALEEEMFQAQKMESLGKAAGAIAHDFNNILTAMYGFNELALDTLPPDSEALRFVKETASGISRGSALVKQILAFSRKQPEDMGVLDLNVVVKGIEPILRMVLEKKNMIKLTLAAGLPAIEANRGQLEQILVNLAVNSRDAMAPKGGEFSITTSEITGEDASRCAAELAMAERAIKLSVADTGCGMTEEMISQAFEPFYTTKPEGAGSGIGLATVYSLVKLHKGGINIVSSPGKGTAFNICFPAVPGNRAHG